MSHLWLLPHPQCHNTLPDTQSMAPLNATMYPIHISHMEKPNTKIHLLHISPMETSNVTIHPLHISPVASTTSLMPQYTPRHITCGFYHISNATIHPLHISPMTSTTSLMPQYAPYSSHATLNVTIHPYISHLWQLLMPKYTPYTSHLWQPLMLQYTSTYLTYGNC